MNPFDSGRTPANSNSSISNVTPGTNELVDLSSDIPPPSEHPIDNSSRAKAKRMMQRFSQLVPRKQRNVAAGSSSATPPGSVNPLTQTEANATASVPGARPEQRRRSYTLPSGEPKVSTGSARNLQRHLERMDSVSSTTSSITSRASLLTTIAPIGKSPAWDLLNDPNASEHAELQLETARLKEFYLTRIDRDGLVRMKSRALDFEDATLGVADTNYALALKCYQRFGDAPPVPTTCWLVEKDDDGNWSATKNGEPKELPDGDYIFVTMADGTIRLGAPENQQNAHCTLSSHAAYVKYAGTIKFREGKPIQGSSQSGTYLPNPKAWINSGFSEDILSNPEDLDYEEIERLYDQGRHPATPPSSEANLSTS